MEDDLPCGIHHVLQLTQVVATILLKIDVYGEFASPPSSCLLLLLLVVIVYSFDMYKTFSNHSQYDYYITKCISSNDCVVL